MTDDDTMDVLTGVALIAAQRPPPLGPSRKDS